MESGIIKIAHKMICRCVGMADEGDSKSLVLITRVGSTPTTGIKRKPSSLSGGLSFYLRRVSGSNSTALLCRASDQPCGLSLSARETPTTGIKRSSPSLSGGVFFLSAARERVEQHGPALQGERSALLTLRDGEQAGIEGEAAPCHHEARLSGTEQ